MLVKICSICGISEKEAELNYEGVIHHSLKLQCKDRKACERRKNRKRNKNFRK